MNVENSVRKEAEEYYALSKKYDENWRDNEKEEV
jgi:hypothetical protein